MIQEVTVAVYERHFEEIYEWFKQIHTQEWEYGVVDLRTTHNKLIELYRTHKEEEKVYFRVLLKATYDDVRNFKTYPYNYKEINILTQTPTERQLLENFGTATQVCVVQLDSSNKPVNAALFTYGSDDKFHRIELGI